MRAAASNGADLVFLGAHPYSTAKIKGNPNVVFDPMFTTRYGVVWKGGSPLAAHQTIHREDVCHLPWAVNANREIGQLAEHFFEGFPPLDVTMGTTNLPMLLEYAQLSENSARPVRQLQLLSGATVFSRSNEGAALHAPCYSSRSGGGGILVSS